LPVAEELNETLLNIPLHPNLSNKDLEYVIEKIKQFN
jgi:dTDP-4-amino-4,6-dideoxygalactose transaminase